MIIIKEMVANDSSLRSFLCWEKAPVSSSPEIMNSAIKRNTGVPYGSDLVTAHFSKVENQNSFVQLHISIKICVYSAVKKKIFTTLNA
jgi:hypothetical protein